MPVLLGLHTPRARTMLGELAFQPHPAGVWFPLPPSGAGPLWRKSYAHWRLQFSNPPRALVNILTQRGCSLAVAESCTGGALASAITDVPGASRVFCGGMVVYTARAKAALLCSPAGKLPPGCVDPLLTGRLAIAAASRLNSDMGLGVTGVLGPAIPGPRVKLGTVYIAVFHRRRLAIHRFNFSGDRHTIKTLATEAGVNLALATMARW